jgi:hypothetical protein
MVLEQVWQVATDFLAPARTGSEPTLEQSLVSLRASLVPVAEALPTYVAWLEEVPASELWTLLYGPDRHQQPLHALRLIAEAIRPSRGVERPSTPLTLRLPLGTAAGAAVCFWLDLTKRLTRWRETIPSFFWSHDGTAGHMLLHLGSPPRSTCAELWQPGRGRDEVCDLIAPIDAAQVAPLPALAEPFATCILSDRPIGELLRLASSS